MKIAILGLGTVGMGVYELIKKELAPEIDVKYILEIRPVYNVDCTVATDINQILQDDEVKVVVETMGGVKPAGDFVISALKAKKHVVTANKQLVSAEYELLTNTAANNSVQLRYTASAGGGIPWLFNLQRTARCGEIKSFKGILNGTTNYILDTMYKKGTDFNAILADAQKLGYAEADPSADIDGLDVQRKCSITANLAFNVHIKPENIPTAGIRHITKEDVDTFKAYGLVCKLIARGKKADESISACVEPVLVPADSLEVNVGSNFNMISLESEYAGVISFYGQGAGRYPTAHCLVQDIIDIYEKSLYYVRDMTPCNVRNDIDIYSYYVRTSNLDAFDGYKDTCLGKGFVTKPLSVAAMHTIAMRARKLDQNLFFAAIV